MAETERACDRALLVAGLTADSERMAVKRGKVGPVVRECLVLRVV
ncbi:MAG TPA: hypothetical protein VMB05_11520 [Solirubrobacteraceae bacterium]|nr:hypothetical protein [Solirubrobacteraceae bacterium]